MASRAQLCEHGNREMHVEVAEIDRVKRPSAETPKRGRARRHLPRRDCLLQE